MKELIPVIGIIVLGGLFTHQSLVEVPEILAESEIALKELKEKNEQELFSQKEKFLAKEKALVDEIKSLESKLQAASKIGLDFKRQLDEEREKEKQVVDAPNVSAPTYNPPPSNNTTNQTVDNSAKRKILLENLEKGKTLLSKIRSEKPNFKEQKLSLGGKLTGIRTSNADRKKWEEEQQERINNVLNYIAAVEVELNKLK